jgi:hypothetical protein
MSTTESKFLGALSAPELRLYILKTTRAVMYKVLNALDSFAIH